MLVTNARMESTDVVHVVGASYTQQPLHSYIHTITHVFMHATLWITNQITALVMFPNNDLATVSRRQVTYGRCK
jgi:hypothetical protein